MPRHSADAATYARPRTMTRLPCPTHWLRTAILLTAACIALGLAATHLAAISSLDLSIDQFISAHHIAAFTTIALAINLLLGPACGVLVAGVICVTIWVARRSFVTACSVGVMIAGGWLMAEVIKHIVNRPRPPAALLADPLVTETGHDSFPSGHTALAVSIAIALAVFAWRTRWFGLAVVLGSVLAVMTAASRLYVGAHFPTDVLGSFLAAPAGILFAIGLWNLAAGRLALPPEQGTGGEAGSEEGA